MKACCKCGKGITSGLIICSECGRSNDVPLRYYIDQLAEDIVLNTEAASCALCVIGSCQNQQSGFVCRKGVKDFLVAKIQEYSENLTQDLHRNKRYYDFLDCKCGGKKISADDMLKILMIQYLGLTKHEALAIVSTWLDIRSLIANPEKAR